VLNQEFSVNLTIPNPEIQLYKYPGLCQVAELHVIRKVLRSGSEIALWQTREINGITFPVMTFDTMPSTLIDIACPNHQFYLVLFKNNEIEFGREFRFDNVTEIWNTVLSQTQNPYMNPNPEMKRFVASLQIQFDQNGMHIPTQTDFKNIILGSFDK
jgi:hypothetical protein